MEQNAQKGSQGLSQSQCTGRISVLCFLFCFFSSSDCCGEAGSHVAQATLRSEVHLRLTLNSLFSCLYLLNVGITDVHH